MNREIFVCQMNAHFSVPSTVLAAGRVGVQSTPKTVATRPAYSKRLLHTLLNTLIFFTHPVSQNTLT